MRTWFLVLGSVVVSGFAALLAVEVVTPDAPSRAARIELPAVQAPRAQRDETSAARRAARVAAREERQAARAERQAVLAEERREARERKEPKLSPEERALTRADARAMQLDELVMANDDVCAQLGVPVEDADELAVLLLDTTEQISAELERVDRGEITWEDVRPAIRRLRLDQAQRAERLLGRQTFREWTLGMGFERFTDEDGEYTRGRLEGRRRH